MVKIAWPEDEKMEDTVDVTEIATQLGEQLIFAIFQNNPIAEVKALVEAGAPVWYQNEAEGTSPLHAAAYIRNLELVQFLINKGAVWNAGAQTSRRRGFHMLINNNPVDYLQNTAGDIALSYNDKEIYTVIRNAGIRAGTPALTTLSNIWIC
jgi:protein arginine N-methyltransferase 2